MGTVRSQNWITRQQGRPATTRSRFGASFGQIAAQAHDPASAVPWPAFARQIEHAAVERHPLALWLLQPIDRNLPARERWNLKEVRKSPHRSEWKRPTRSRPRRNDPMRARRALRARRACGRLRLRNAAAHAELVRWELGSARRRVRRMELHVAAPRTQRAQKAQRDLVAVRET